MARPVPYATKAAIPLPSEDEVKKVVGESYNANALNVVKMLAGTGKCFAPTLKLVKALFYVGINGSGPRPPTYCRPNAIINPSRIALP